MRLTGAMIYAKDLQRMAAFYQNVLGLQCVAETRTESWVEFNAGAATLALHAIPPDIAAGIEVSSPPQPREDTLLKLIFQVDDLASLRSRLELAGASILERPWGAWDVTDPEGNILSITSRA